MAPPSGRGRGRGRGGSRGGTGQDGCSEIDNPFFEQQVAKEAADNYRNFRLQSDFQLLPINQSNLQ